MRPAQVRKFGQQLEGDVKDQWWQDADRTGQALRDQCFGHGTVSDPVRTAVARYASVKSTMIELMSGCAMRAQEMALAAQEIATLYERADDVSAVTIGRIISDAEQRLATNQFSQADDRARDATNAATDVHASGMPA